MNKKWFQRQKERRKDRRKAGKKERKKKKKEKREREESLEYSSAKQHETVKERKEERHITLLNNGRGRSLWLVTAAGCGCFRKAVSPMSQKGIQDIRRMESQRSSMEVTCDCNLFQGQFLVREKGRSLPGMFFLCPSRRLLYRFAGSSCCCFSGTTKSYSRRFCCAN